MAKFTGHTITSDSALGAAKIQRSLRFNHDDSPYLSFTPSTTGNQKIWTFSAWIKRIEITSDRHYIYSADNGSGSAYFALYFDNDNIKTYFDPGNNYGIVNDREYRDTTAWMHIVHQVDATNTVQRIWINGVEETLSSSRNPGNSNYPMNESGKPIIIGRHSWGTSYYNNMYLAEVNHVDGQLIAPTDFGFTDPVTNIWMPKRYEGTYGTNGFYLDFSDNSSTASLGIDKSPNGNDFSVNNFSVGAWPDNDSVIDTPTNNFNTFNDNDKNSNVPLANGALETAATATGGHYPAFTTIPVKSGKWYLEWKFLTNDSGLPSIMEAIHDENSYSTDSTVGNNTSTVNKRGYGFLPGNGNTSAEGGYASYGSALTSSDTGQCAFDADTGKIYWGKNNTWFNSGNPETGANPAFSGIDMTKEYLFTWHVYGNNNNVSVNFGSQGFTYTPPSGFRALCTENLSATQAPSVVTRPQRHFETLLYTGNNTDGHTIDGLEFTPALVWIKNRSSGVSNYWVDSMRKSGSDHLYLVTNTNGAEADASPRFTSINRGGFTVPSGGSFTNSNGHNFVAWCWKAGGNSHTYNIDGTGYATAAAAGLDGGTIDPTGASINTEAGFSIVTYSANGTAGATVAHGLGKKPAWIIIKCRSNGDNWMVYQHQVNGGVDPEDYYLQLNETDAITDSPNMLNDTAPTDTLVTINNDGAVNSGSRTYVMYCWSEIPGYSKFGSYTGNGSSTGQYVKLGFRAAWIMIKGAHSDIWYIYDNKRNPGNVVDKELNTDRAQSEATFTTMDFLSNGFKLRTNNSSFNYDSYTYLYFAFAEQPGVTSFDVVSNAR